MSFMALPVAQPSRLKTTTDGHRWTQMNTDTEDCFPDLLRRTWGHYPPIGMLTRRSAAWVVPYLCSSVSICGFPLPGYPSEIGAQVHSSVETGDLLGVAVEHQRGAPVSTLE